MFDRAIDVKGVYAEIMTKLTNVIDSKNNICLFKRNKDVLKIAPIIGLVYNRKEKFDTSKNETPPRTINGEQVISIKDVLTFTYRLVMLNDSKDKFTLEERINKAFKDDVDPEKLKENMEVFFEYFYGGMKVLKEKLVDGCVSTNDYLEHFNDFIEEYESRYYNQVSDETILKMCLLGGE